MPCSSTDDRICRSWIRVRPEVSCASRSAGSSDLRLRTTRRRGSPRRNAQPLGFVGPLDLDFHGLRRPDDARADVGEVLGDQHER